MKAQPSDIFIEAYWGSLSRLYLSSMIDCLFKEMSYLAIAFRSSI